VTPARSASTRLIDLLEQIRGGGRRTRDQSDLAARRRSPTWSARLYGSSERYSNALSYDLVTKDDGFVRVFRRQLDDRDYWEIREFLKGFLWKRR
jgi:hypothetical protein